MAIEVRTRPYTYCFSGNPVHYELYSALAAGDATVFFETRIQFKNIGGAYTPSPALPYNPVEGVATIDAQDLLDGLLEYELPGFDVNEKLLWAAAKHTGEFYLQFREITSVNPDPDWDDSEKEYAAFVMKGGIGRWKYQGNNFWVNYFKLADADALRPFFTWQPVPDDQSNNRKRLVAADERIYLLYLNLATVAGRAAKAKAFYTDGSTLTVTNAITAAGGAMLENVPYYIPAGAKQWGLIDAGKSIHYWEIAIIDLNTPNKYFTETIRFYQDNRKLDNRTNYNDITISYRSSLGGIDTARIRGVIERSMDYNFSEQATYQAPDYFDGHYFTPQKLVFNCKEKMIYKGDIGYLEKEEQDRLRDMHVKRDSWWEVGKKWWPMNIVTKSNKHNTTEDALFSVPLEFTHADDGDTNYTPMSVDLGDGVFTSNVCRAYMSPMSVVRDAVTADNAWVINGAEVDPQNASAQVRYRVIKDSDGSVAVDWQPGAWGLPLPFAVPNDTGTYKVEVQALCANTIYGKITTATIDTTTGGGAPPPPGNSIVQNHTNTQGFFGVDINSGAEMDTDSIGANNVQDFTTTSVGVFDVLVTLDFVPAFVGLSAGGGAYTATPVGTNQWLFTGVDIVDGITIDLY
jgi:hypothetical protein